MLVEDMKIWEKRWDALREQIEQTREPLRERCNADTTLGDSRRRAVGALGQLLGCLKGFGQGQFDYFKNQFLGKPPGEDECPEYPQEHVMMVTLDQIGYDLWVINHAIEQRFSKNPAVNATLEKADKLSYHALQPAIHAFGLDKTHIISYLHKSPSIRVIPYANSALIGIPHTAVSVPRDFLAIPHEVGHFVYWNGMKKGAERPAVSKMQIGIHLATQAPQKESWANRWLEELFADIYGSFVAGPVLALSFQDLQMQQSQVDFYADDMDHPPPVLRPNIYAKGVCRAGFTNWANLLEKNWNDPEVGKRYQRAVKKTKPTETAETSTTTYDYAFKLEDDTWVEVEKAISLVPADLDKSQPLNCLIDFIFSEVVANLNIDGENWWRKDVVDCDGSSTVEGLSKLFEDFEKKINALQADSEDIMNDERTNIECVSHEELRERWENSADADPPWLPVFQAGGWTTEGPEGNPTGP